MNTKLELKPYRKNGRKLRFKKQYSIFTGTLLLAPFKDG